MGGEEDGDDATVRGKMSTPNRKLKRYSTGLAKWCNRYISECYGQRVMITAFYAQRNFWHH